MAPEEPKAVLYDFLYRDSGRIASYYAQLFGGRLSSLEESDTVRQAVEKGVGVTPSIIGGSIKSSNETATGARRTIDPHELITTDVLNALKKQGFLHTNHPTHAPHGSLVLAQGTVVFLDRSIVQMAGFALDAALSAEKAKPNRERNKNTIDAIGLVKTVLSAIVIPSAFLLDIASGGQVAGTIKDDGMEEPISTYYFRHGTAGLSNVYLLGIKEVPSGAISLPGKDLMAAGQQAAQALNDLLFPPSTIKVTPIVLFREL